MSRRWCAVLLGGVVILAAACTGGEGASTETSVAASASTTAPEVTEVTAAISSTPEVTIEVTAGATTESTTGPVVDTATDAAAALSGWERIVPGGDCRCANGSEFGFWIRRADPAKVLFFLQGGGACFSAETCDPEAGTYRASTDPGEFPGRDGGIFDAADGLNPFADHSIVYVPYCTGDVHLGDRVTTYAPGLTVNHVGAINAGAAFDELIASFPDATEVVVAGESAGAIPAPIYGARVADLLPDARVDVLADGAGVYPDLGGVNALIDSHWGAVDALPDWPETAALTAETWSISELFVVAGEHAPDVTMARHDYAFDATQAAFLGLAGVPTGDLLSFLDANEVAIEADGVDLHSYVAPGDDHTVLSGSAFYTEEVDGQPFVDWVRQLVADAPVADVHCTVCGP